MSVMLSSGYELGKNLGTILQGIIEPIKLQCHSTIFGLRYAYSVQENLNCESLKVGIYYSLPKPLPLLHHTF